MSGKEHSIATYSVFEEIKDERATKGPLGINRKILQGKKKKNSVLLEMINSIYEIKCNV